MRPNGAPPRSEPELVQRAAQIAGRTLQQVADGLGMPVPANLRRHKGWVGSLLERVLGADAASLSEPDFTALGIELKTLPIDRHGRPKESTFVCVVPLSAQIGPWESSNVRRKLARVLWVTVEAAAEIPMPLRRIGSAMLWSPSQEQERDLHADWEELTEMIALGRLHEISARHGRLLQIRPKAANARALTASFNEHGEPAQTLPRGFYLRAGFTSEILRTLGNMEYGIRNVGKVKIRGS